MTGAFAVKLVLPRVIYGNLGDLASRWGALRALHLLGAQDVTVFRHLEGDTPTLPFRALDYRPLHNLRLDRPAWEALRRADVVLWAVGLDMQDDSSLARLLYLWTVFRFYRALGLNIVCLFQGAGPITTAAGRLLGRAVLSHVETFAARDPGTYALIERLNPRTKRVLAHDAIFLPGFEEDLAASPSHFDSLFETGGRPVIGINLRQWFHFASSLLPYQLARRKYLKRSETRMGKLLRAAANLTASLRTRQRARVLLISAYQTGIRPWEDDMPWLERLKANFAEDDEVQIVPMTMSLPAYFRLMSRLDLMIGMRLHSSLIALRFGVPSINLSYTLKGGDILRHLGLPDSIADLNDFIESPQAALERAESILAAREAESEQVRAAVEKAIETNMSVMKSVLNAP